MMRAPGVVDYAEPVCQSLSGQCLDTFIRQQILAALQPPRWNCIWPRRSMSSRSVSDCINNAGKNVSGLDTRPSGRARQYQAVEPENRLVARELERRWEAAIQKQQQVQEDYERFCRSQPATLSAAEREQIRALANDIPALWDGESTSPADRQQIVRFLLEKIVISVQGAPANRYL